MEFFNGFGKGELFILRYLFEKNASATPTELSEALHSSTARVSAALGTLEKKGQIHREIDLSSRRSILVTITDAGRHRIFAIKNQIKVFLLFIMTEMGENDAAEFVRLFTKFHELTEQGIYILSEKP